LVETKKKKKHFFLWEMAVTSQHRSFILKNTE